MTFISYAQNLEDALLWRVLGQIESGFYIDVGAVHPDLNSATRAFYERGWSGINVAPTPEAIRRLQAARPRDVTVQTAPGAVRGRMVLQGAAPPGHAVGEVEAADLTEICQRHAPSDIHFLRVAAEDSERVLAGIDLARFRPWIVLVATPAGAAEAADSPAAERILLAAGYRLAWFDGLNRFYAAGERAAALAPRFRALPGTEWMLRARQAEMQAAALRDQLAGLEVRARSAEERAERAALQLSRETALTAGAEMHGASMRREVDRLHREVAWRQKEVDRLHREVAWRHDKLESLDERLRQADEQLRRNGAERADLALRLAVLEREAASARLLLGLTHASTSWRLTRPLRGATRVAGRLSQRLRASRHLAIASPAMEVEAPESLAIAAVAPLPPPVPSLPEPAVRPARLAGEGRLQARPARTAPIRTIHQFHAGSATGDAITNAMLLTRKLLREAGYRSEIYVAHRDPALADELRTLAELPRHAEYVLLLRHSMGHDALADILDLPAPKVLIYHNITPPQQLWRQPFHQDYARLGRDQLALIRPHVSSALADSEYNALELRLLGFDPVQACPLLFDIAAMRAPSREAAQADRPFTVLFVGRVAEAKGQADLIEAFARFRAAWDAPARLVLVGRHDGDSYHAGLLAAVRRHGLDGDVVLTGAVSDTARDAWYDQADLYVSLSQHEGFGVPLIEAMARGVPVLARPAGAVAETLGGAAELLDDPAPSAVAGHVLALARDPARRTRLSELGRRAVERFSLERHVPRLIEAAVRAGAAPPPDAAVRDMLADRLRFVVAGHVNGTYSLAAINRAVAVAVEAERPGAVRVLPVEGEPTDDLARVPPSELPAIRALAGRLASEVGPEAVVSQHYPLYVPRLRPGDLPLSLFFWEESAVPAETVAALNESFAGVLAPTRFVAKALVDSGVWRPIRVLGQAPPLGPYRALAAERRARPRPPGPFTFLHVSSCFPRKGVDRLLAAYARAFRRGDPVRLVIKGFPNPHNDVAEQIARLRAASPDFPEIRLVDEDLDEPALLALYRDADAMVLPTRGEGYNLPAAEAMAAGLPLIVTGFGGHTDFLGPEEARLVDFAFAPSGSHLASVGSVWADPDVDDLARALRETFEDLPAARERAARAEARIADETGRAKLVTTLADTALDLLLAPPPPSVRVAWVSTWSVRCGIAEYSRQLLDALPRDGIAELVVLADERTAAQADSDAPRVSRAWRYGDRASIPQLATALAAEDPHVTVVQHQPGLLSWSALARLLGERAVRERPVVVVLHNTRHLLELTEVERRAVLDALAGASRLLVHTVADLNGLKALGLVANVSLLPHGTAEPLPARAPRRLIPEATGADAPLIGCYGFFLPRKGLPQLVQALAILRRSWPGARLRLVNARYDAKESDAEIARCRTAVARAGLDGAVEFVTEFLPPERSLALLAGCDVVALPYQSSLEASSAAMRVAFAAGAPVAVTPLPLFDEAGEAVVRFEGIDPDAIAAGLDALLGDGEHRAVMAERARRWLLDRRWDIAGQRVAGMLRGLAAKAAHGGSAGANRA